VWPCQEVADERARDVLEESQGTACHARCHGIIEVAVVDDVVLGLSRSVIRPERAPHGDVDLEGLRMLLLVRQDADEHVEPQSPKGH
jgi:hypothetical protein